MREKIKSIDSSATEWESHWTRGQLQAWEETSVQGKAVYPWSMEKGAEESLPESQ